MRGQTMNEKIEALKKELDEIETSKFYLDMKDHWSADDYRINEIYNNRIRKLKAQIEEMEGTK